MEDKKEVEIQTSDFKVFVYKLSLKCIKTVVNLNFPQS